MADGVFPGLISKDRNVNAVTNPIFTQLTDGTVVVGVTAGALDVNIDNATIAVTQSGVWDIGTVTTLTGITNDVNIADGGNSITVDGTVAISGTVAVTQSGTWTIDSITNDVSISDGGNSITVDAVNLDIRDLTHATDSVKVGDGTEFLAINTDGSINVNVVTAVSADEVHDFDQAVDVASDTADNHDYTVVNTTFLLTSIIFASSGDAKFEVQVGALASLATVAVGFVTGKQGDTKQLKFDPAIEVPVTGTGTIRVIRTNREGQTQDLYSTIIGRDIA